MAVLRELRGWEIESSRRMTHVINNTRFRVCLCVLISIKNIIDSAQKMGDLLMESKLEVLVSPIQPSLSFDMLTHPTTSRQGCVGFSWLAPPKKGTCTLSLHSLVTRNVIPWTSHQAATAFCRNPKPSRASKRVKYHSIAAPLSFSLRKTHVEPLPLPPP